MGITSIIRGRLAEAKRGYGHIIALLIICATIIIVTWIIFG